MPNDTQPVNIKPVEGIIEGYPIVFNQITPIGDLFFEEIDEHALDGADLSDIKFLVNHNDDMIPLARHRRGKRSTMDISINEHGLSILAKLDIENNSTSKAVCSAVERGDIEDMSFAFGIEVTGEETEAKTVTFYNSDNQISARSASLDNEKRALDNARAVALENENRAAKEKAQAALMLEKQKFLFMEELRK